MSGVDAQLMGAPCERRETHARVPCPALQNLPIRYSQLAMHRIQDLSRSILNIDAEGEFDMSTLLLDTALQQSNIGFAYKALLELAR